MLAVPIHQPVSDQIQMSTDQISPAIRAISTASFCSEKTKWQGQDTTATPLPLLPVSAKIKFFDSSPSSPSSATTCEVAQRRASVQVKDALRQSKAFQVFLNRAVVKIQALTRGARVRESLYHVQAKIKQTKAVIRIQSLARRVLAQNLFRAVLAAIKLQSVVRAHLGRMHCRIIQLERRLAAVKLHGHASELECIETEKIKSMGKIRAKYQDKYDLVKKQQTEIEKTKKIICKLKDSNRSLRNENDKLQKSCTRLIKKNLDLECNTALTSRAVTPERVEQIAREVENWKAVLKQFKERREEFEEGIQKSIDFGEYEHKLGILVRDSIEAIVDMVAEASEDQKLIDCILREAREVGISQALPSDRANESDFVQGTNH